jgi:hypothetical protein|tara:strand:- start:896 stop:1279 length:384 start_codon:yes stop_codon:yes gene_type:complete
MAMFDLAIIKAACDHLDAQMSQSPKGISSSTTFPFFHIFMDGNTIIFKDAPEMAAFGSRPYTTKIIEAEIIDSGGQSAVIKLIFQRYDPNGVKTTKAKAIWGITKIKNSWKVHWRQFLGEITATETK